MCNSWAENSDGCPEWKNLVDNADPENDEETCCVEKENIQTFELKQNIKCGAVNAITEGSIELPENMRSSETNTNITIDNIDLDTASLNIVFLKIGTDDKETCYAINKRDTNKNNVNRGQAAFRNKLSNNIRSDGYNTCYLRKGCINFECPEDKVHVENAVSLIDGNDEETCCIENPLMDKFLEIENQRCSPVGKSWFSSKQP